MAQGGSKRLQLPAEEYFLCGKDDVFGTVGGTDDAALVATSVHAPQYAKKMPLKEAAEQSPAEYFCRNILAVRQALSYL